MLYILHVYTIASIFPDPEAGHYGASVYVCGEWVCGCVGVIYIYYVLCIIYIVFGILYSHHI